MGNDDSPLWELMSRLLPPGAEWYRPADIAALFGLTPRAVMKHCRDLWPSRDGQYRLSFDEARRVIRRICFAGRRVPSREIVEAKLRQKEVRQ